MHTMKVCTANSFASRVAMTMAALSVMVVAAAHAAQYPERPIRFIVPSAPGGTPDISSRLITAEMSKYLGQQFVIDNRPTGNGVVGTDAIAKATPDGYTMGQGNVMTLAIARSVLTRLPYDVERDLAIIGQYGYTCNLLAVSPALPINTVQDLIDHARKNPGKLTFGSAGNGSSMHLSGELLKAMTGTQMVHVPYKAAQQAITEIIGGQIQFMFDNMSSILPHAKAGRLRGIGVTSTKRWRAAPEYPTLAESGVPGFEVVPWGGFITPSGVPKPILDRLNRELNRAISKQEVGEKMSSLGTEPLGGTPEQFAEFVRKENAKWAEVVKRAGIKVD